jgi:hypothetical protein
MAYAQGRPIEGEVYDDELDPELLEGIALAERRFDWLLRRQRAS